MAESNGGSRAGRRFLVALADPEGAALALRYRSLVSRADRSRDLERGPGQDRIWEHDAFDAELEGLRAELHRAIGPLRSDASGNPRHKVKLSVRAEGWRSGRRRAG